MSSVVPLIVLVFIVFIGIAIAIAVVQAQRAKARREAFATWASSQGWGYAERDDRWVDAFPDAPFGRGHNKSARNVITGTHDSRPFVAFDYRYYTTETSTDGEGRTTTREVAHPYAIVATQLGAQLPELSVTPEGFFSRTIGRISGNDIELESEDFNRAFTVNCPDRKFASDVLHPQTMEFLLQHPNLSFRFAAGHALTVKNGQFEQPEIDSRLRILDSLIDLIPEFVWRERRG